MPTIHVYDPALCCASGICGEEVDQNLVDFSAVLRTAKAQGITVVRHNLATEPLDFASCEAVRTFLAKTGVEGLPVIVVDEEIVMSGQYPGVEQLRAFATQPGTAATTSLNLTPASLPLVDNSNGCGCGGNC